MLLALMGLPACGKSTLTSELAVASGGVGFVEPEESDWPAVVLDTHTYGQFECLMWFRNTRVPMYLKAASLARQGRFAVVDSVWDKLFISFMAESCMHWVLSPESPYYEAAQAVAAADHLHLPDPDAIVFITVDEMLWLQLLRQRGREYDVNVGLAEHFEMQRVLHEVVVRYCQARDIPLLTLRQELLTPKDAADQILCELRQTGLA